MPADGAPSGAADPHRPAAEDLVRQTRREIAEIVREVAALARRPLDQSTFFASLADATLRALAAEGVVIWRADDDRCRPLVRTGRLTDRQIPPAGRAAHAAMLAEILATGTPVIVPPTPLGHPETAAAEPADEPSVAAPANPTTAPAAVVPILDPLHEAPGGAEDVIATTSGAPRYLLEVFLEAEAGVATQRGYLRFVAQMADLAGDYLRLAEIRHGRQLARDDAALAAVTGRLAQHHTSAGLALELVDALAELFDAARVTLLAVDRRRLLGVTSRGRLLAVSHVDRIDHRGAACRQLVARMMEIEFTAGQSLWFPRPASAPTSELPAAVPVGDPGCEDVPLVDWAAIALCPSGSESSQWRYRLLIQTHAPRRVTPLQRRLLQRVAAEVEAILRPQDTIDAIPLARLWLKWLPATDPAGRWLLRPLVVAIGLLVAVAGIAAIPTPMRVSAPATLRAAGQRTHYAPAAAMVEEVLVRHGEKVSAGQQLMLLHDVALEEQVTALASRRAVAGEKLAKVLAALVTNQDRSVAAGSNDQRARDDTLVQQQRLLEEELRGIDQQLALLDDARQRLVIRSEIDGIVQAWQTEWMAVGKPVRVGEPLLAVQPLQPRWMADTRIEQRRAGVVFDDAGGCRHAAVLRFPDDLAAEHPVRFVRRARFEPQAGGDRAVALVEFEIDDPALPSDDGRLHGGAPVEVTIDCGRQPLFRVLLFDFIRSVRLWWARW